jgi:hypothetical protein
MFSMTGQSKMSRRVISEMVFCAVRGTHPILASIRQRSGHWCSGPIPYALPPGDCDVA